MTGKKWFAWVVAFAVALPLAATAEDAPGVFKIPGTESTLKIYGYVQYNLIVDFEQPGGDWATDPAGLPSDSNFVSSPRLQMNAYQSRFGFSTSTPSALGTIGTKIEGDFLGTDKGGSIKNFRLRHAYGTIGDSVLIGQTDSTFSDGAAGVDTVDFNGPAANGGSRTPQIRMTLPLAEGATLSLAAEKPSTLKNGYSTFPDVAGAITYGGDWGHVSLRGVTMNYMNINHMAQGFAATLAGAFNISGDTLVFAATAGEAVGDYMTTGNTTQWFDGNTIKVLQSAAYYLGYTHVWSPEFRSNLVWGQTYTKKDNNTAAGDIQRVDQAFVNTFWTAAKNFELGLEYNYGRRYLFGGDDSGVQSRVQFAAHYNFY